MKKIRLGDIKTAGYNGWLDRWVLPALVLPKETYVPLGKVLKVKVTLEYTNYRRGAK
jgi:hypothetical protein